MTHRNALVTGGSGGVGRAVAAKLTAAGTTVELWGTNERRLAQVVEQGAAAGYRLVDITSADEVSAGVASLRELPGSVSLVVHCAGVWTPGHLAEVTDQALARHIAIVAQGSALVARAAIRLISPGPGSFVQIAAASAKPGFADTALNMLAKRAQDGLQEGLSRELRGTGIRVTTIYPDSISASDSESVRAGQAMTYADVAAAVLFAANAPTTVKVDEIVLTAPATGRW